LSHYPQLSRTVFDGAQTDFMQALHMHQELANFSGQATCQKGLGKIAQQRSNHAESKTHFLNALELYGRIPEHTRREKSTITFPKLLGISPNANTTVSKPAACDSTSTVQI
jgi:hypothetical protein